MEGLLCNICNNGQSACKKFQNITISKAVMSIENRFRPMTLSAIVQMTLQGNG